MMSARNSYPFTQSQWQELEHQALIFKYMVSGIPIPPYLLYIVKRSLDTSMSSGLYSHQPIGLGCFDMSLGRKADLEPGRCRRTDGKKWRCSKEAHPDSKYCERHMHRGRNHSRKPVEMEVTTSTNPSLSISSISTIPNSTASCYSLSSLSSSIYSEAETHPNHHSYNNNLPYPSLHPQSSSSRPGSYRSPQNNITHHLFLGTDNIPQSDNYPRCLNGMREAMDERTFFPDTSGRTRILTNSFSPLTMRSSSYDYSQLNYQSLTDKSKEKQQEEEHCFVLGTDFKSARSIKEERAGETHMHFHHFLDE